MSDTVATARSDAQCCDHFVGVFFFTNVGGREGVQGSRGVGIFVEMDTGSVGWYRGESAVGEAKYAGEGSCRYNKLAKDELCVTGMQESVVSGASRLQRKTGERKIT